LQRLKWDRAAAAAAVGRRREMTAKSTYSLTTLVPAGITGSYEMHELQTDLMQAAPSIIPSDVPALSDDECLVRLARAIDDHDSAHLDELARLIARLAVTIE
jgi:hypothetical protein